MLKKTLNYSDLDNFFEQIKDQNNNITHYCLRIGPDIPPDECAHDLEEILNYFVNHGMTNLEIKFIKYYPKNKYPLPIASSLANMIAQGIYPKDLIIDFSDGAFDTNCTIALAQALEFGDCVQSFTIKLKHVFYLTIEAFANALMSGRCPRGFHLDISEHIGLDSMLVLLRALRHPNCPENLSLSLYYPCDSGNAGTLLSNALRHGEIPKGFSIKFYGKGNGNAYTLASSFLSNNLPEDLTIELHHVAADGGDVLQRYITIGAKKNSLPPGLKINLLKTHHFSPVKITEILQKNTMKHAALAATTLWQGHRQNTNILSSLPIELMDSIQTYGFYNSALPFFNTGLAQKEKIFTRKVKQLSSKLV